MSGKMTKFKDLLVDTPNRYTVNGEVKTIVFSPNTITQEGTKDKAEYFNEMQKNGLYNVNATRVVEGTVEFYDITIDGSDIFDVFDTQFIINFNETNTKLNPVLRFNGNNYYIRALDGFVDIDVQIGSLQKTYIGFLDSTNNKLKLMNYERKLIFDTVEELQTATWLIEGDTIQLLGYYSKNDGAGHYRKIEVSDDGSGIAVGSLWANYVLKNGIAFVDDFGAKGDGVSDDYSIFQRVINLYSDIYINSNKTYLISTSLNMLGLKNLHSNGGKIKSGITAQQPLIKIRNSKNKVENITFDGAKESELLNDYKTCLDIRTATDTHIIGNTICNFYADGIYNSHSNYTRIENNRIESCNRNMITLTGNSNNITIKDNEIYNVIYNGINYESSSEDYSSYFINIENNNLYNDTVKGAAINLTGIAEFSEFIRYYNVFIKNNKIKNMLEGIQIRACSSIIVSDNFIENSRVKVSEFGESVFVEIKNNTLKNSALYTYKGLKDSTVIGNNIYGSNLDGITINSIKNSIISDNLIKSVGNTGIYLLGSFEQVKINNNTILDSKLIGIRISATVEDSKLEISNNTILDLSSEMDYGIRFYGNVGNVLIKDNLIKSLYGDILEDESTPIKVGNNLRGVFSKYSLSSIKSNYGTYSGSGNGVLTSFSFPHNGNSAPAFVYVIPTSVNAGVSEINYVNVNATNITVYFKTAPTTTFTIAWKADF